MRRYRVSVSRENIILDNKECHEYLRMKEWEVGVVLFNGLQLFLFILFVIRRFCFKMKKSKIIITIYCLWQLNLAWSWLRREDNMALGLLTGNACRDIYSYVTWQLKCANIMPLLFCAISLTATKDFRIITTNRKMQPEDCQPDNITTRSHWSIRSRNSVKSLWPWKYELVNHTLNWKKEIKLYSCSINMDVMLAGW